MDREAATVREKLAADYRIVCPLGHTSLRPAETTPTAYCQTCSRAYSFDELTDRRRDTSVADDS